MRKTVVATVAVIVLGLVASLVWQYKTPLPHGFPTDRALVKLFHDHRQTFDTLAQMADKDATIAWGNTSDSLSVSRRSEYSRLLSQIDSRITMNFDPWRIAFWFAGGGFAIGPRWGKGITYLTAVPNRVGEIVRNLDKDPGHDDVYLVPIEGDWYVICMRDDYDNPKSIRSNQSMKPTAPDEMMTTMFVTTSCRGLSLSR